METKSIFYLEVDKIKPNPFQPRREFNEEALQDLANSIREFGILEPLIVTRIEEQTELGTQIGYELLAGERRLRAAKIVGLNTVPAIIKEQIEEREKLEIALIENLQREDINSIERAKAFSELADKFKLSQREIAYRVGKSREFVANTLRLLQLPFEIQKALEDGKISEGHGRVILTLDSLDDQRVLLGRIISYSLTVRQAEASAKELKRQREPLSQPHDELSDMMAEFDPQTEQIKTKLEETLQARVMLKKKGEKGMIAINFNSSEELANILKRIIGEQGVGEL
ncbi:MAG: ParB-like protein partition protein [Parcubacteria group bacterium GW2011_GWB1_46_8]|nr:MAG: ParB-like protein partition protein [Parcubacteria group bacterium GW2011_GWF1_45_5]KKU11301.1 MAG: ParB-like protein partition protein [Parcubacteria group bacterium GW2011_GWA1_45_7]KKU43920.1 MAG: ParB-like protein partition protein [Parcubacteria group bacterium GW2011_GWA2_46_7]KKU45915.1 MAG: ParB-like protein partition protein [Parcubacteria group bacterium GW2011_GWB1_46_8]